MLYSCLVDADFLETESFMKNNHVGTNIGGRNGIFISKTGKTYWFMVRKL